MSTLTLTIIAVCIAVAAGLAYWLKYAGRPVPAVLRPGQKLPEFVLQDEQGNDVRSSELRGTAAVLVFVRGRWCPFCSSQVENLSVHYKNIVDLGARLILITPKPLETTRRVATFFDVKFDYWLDADLRVARELGLLSENTVPKKHRDDFGADAIWPTALVVDAGGTIRFAAMSKLIADRPNPKTLVAALKDALKTPY